MLNVLQLLEQEGIRFREAGQEAILNECPFDGCIEKLTVNLESGDWVCWKCSEGNTIKNARGGSYLLLRNILGFDERRIREILGGGTASSYSDDMRFTPIGGPSEVQEASVYEIPRWFTPDSAITGATSAEQAFITYIHGRGISQATLARFPIWFDANNLKAAVLIQDESGAVVGHQVRDITDRWERKQVRCGNRDRKGRFDWKFDQLHLDGQPCEICQKPLETHTYEKVLSSRGLSRSSIWFGEHVCDFKRPVVLTEGPFDTFNCPNALAPLGRGVSPDQVWSLARREPPEVIIYFDGDQAGVDGTADLGKLLQAFVSLVTVASPPWETDPGDYTMEQNMEIISRRVTFDDWARSSEIPMM